LTIFQRENAGSKNPEISSSRELTTMPHESLWPPVQSKRTQSYVRIRHEIQDLNYWFKIHLGSWVISR